MSSEEKTTWVQGILAVVGYPVYLFVLLSRLGDGPITELPYVDVMLWVIGGSVVTTIVVVIILGILSPRTAGKKDTRDREIYRHGEYVGQSLVTVGALAVMVMAWLEIDWFWIANAIFLAFFLSAILGFITKVVGYRAGLPRW